MIGNYIFTSESVGAGHPDKICDQISDAILDEVLRQDPYGKVGVETLVTVDRIVIAGEVRAKAKLDYEQIAREQIKRLGYTDPKLRFTYKSPISVYVHTQSPEIAVGVDNMGAGDQGMMFGFACKDTEVLMPMAITLAHRIVEKIDQLRESGTLQYLHPDGKSQVTVQYKNGKPSKICNIVVAVPHDEKINLQQVKKDIFEKAVEEIVGKYAFTIKPSDVVVNGTGVWHFSGPAADTGLTGRKIIVDTYGGYAGVGGGAFSGKDPSKVDRSGAYAARFIAKNIVANGLCDKAEVRLAYFIGAKKPLMQEVETFGTEKKPKKVIADFASKLLDTSLSGIIEGLNLARPIYLPTACYGHFGREQFPWEKVVENV